MSLNNYLMIKTAKEGRGTWATMNREASGDNDLPPGYSEYVRRRGNIGRTMGATSDDTDLDQLVADYYGNPMDDMVPGRAGYKMYHQKRVIENILKNRKGGGNKTLSELRGRGTSAILPTLLGTSIGAYTNKKDRKLGASVGTLAGMSSSLLANLAGMGAAHMTKHRDLDELEDYYNRGMGTTLGNYLIPGMGAYNDWKNSLSTDDLIEAYAEQTGQKPKGKTESKNKLKSNPKSKNTSNKNNSKNSDDWMNFDSIIAK